MSQLDRELVLQPGRPNTHWIAAMSPDLPTRYKTVQRCLLYQAISAKGRRSARWQPRPAEARFRLNREIQGNLGCKSIERPRLHDAALRRRQSREESGERHGAVTLRTPIRVIG